MEIAETYNLPQDVTNLIAEHHGTTKVLYFFELAKEKKLKMKTTDFKYHGPVPMSKESAILMLADSIEAATRAIEGLNEEKIFQVIDNIMNDRIKTHQLKHSNLTQPEISKIKDSFIKTVQSIYHQRLNYKRDE